MRDCKFETILSNEQGFAKFCTSCGELHIGFMSNLLIFYPDNFSSFLNDMEYHLKKRRTDHVSNDLKNIVIPTPMYEISLLFSLNELREFVHFLKKTWDAIIIKALVNDITSKDWITMN